MAKPRHPSVSKLPHNLHIVEARHLIKAARNNINLAIGSAAEFGEGHAGGNMRQLISELTMALRRVSKRLSIAADELAISKRRSLAPKYTEYEEATGHHFGPRAGPRRKNEVAKTEI